MSSKTATKWRIVFRVWCDESGLVSENGHPNIYVTDHLDIVTLAGTYVRPSLGSHGSSLNYSLRNCVLVQLHALYQPLVRQRIAGSGK